MGAQSLFRVYGLGFRVSFLGFRFFSSARNVKIFTLNTGVKEKREQENER